MQRHNSAGPAQRVLQKGWAAYNAGKHGEAEKNADLARRMAGNLPEAFYLKALALQGMKRNAEARALAERCAEQFPDNGGFPAVLASIAISEDRHADARDLLRKRLDMSDGNAQLWSVYGTVLFHLGDYEDARIAGEKAVSMEPNNATFIANYASALRESGSTVEAIPFFRKACALDPLMRVNRSNLLFSLLYDEHVSAQELRREAEDWAGTLARSAIAPDKPLGARTPRIRIGILSNDLRRHACAYYLLPLIANLDRRHFEVHLFSLSGVDDKITAKIRQYADGFHNAYGKSEDQVVAEIREIGIDVMVDLGGYTGASPLQYMVHRLAPVQIAWLGYPSTTGMKEVQYRITDWIGDPEGFESNYTEKLLRAPLFCAYHPNVTNPLYIYEQKYRVQPTPALANGYITFGSCNHIAKLTPKTMRLWSAVLARCPDSRLLVEAAGLEKESVRTMLVTRMEGYGIDTGRVILVPRDGANQYLTYHRIDIALDTAPVTGGTTTCDTLWMGVPLVTLTGDTFHQRVSAPFLHVTGLDELMCDTEERYVEIASELASDVERLNTLRLSLRDSVERGPMCDAPAFTGWFEDTVIEILRDIKPLAEPRGERQQGMFFGGTWYTVEDLVLSVAAHLHMRDYVPLRNVLENLTSTWYRHWIVAYGLAEIKYNTGSREEAIELLVESIGMRPYSIPLYRLLALWLDECGLDKSSLVQLLDDQFGLTLEALEDSPPPTVFEVLGIQVETQDADTSATQENEVIA